MTEAPDLSPAAARDRWLDKLRASYSDATVSTYYYRLKLFTEWAEENGIDAMQEVSGWDLDTYEGHRRSQDIELTTAKNEMSTLKNWLEYLASVEVVDDDLPEKVDVPLVPPEDRSSDTKLSTEAAVALLEHYRTSSTDYATRAHAILELIWHTGARVGAIRALDVMDMRETDQGERYLQFANRPETGTRLKKGNQGERPVLLNEDVWEVLDTYVDTYREAVHDDHGRQPLIASADGRPLPGTLRDWMYLATIPCLHSPCPHDRDPITCEYIAYARASGCPSSRPPHDVRTGSITWMRNRGIPAEVVAERVNSSVATIEEHYDKEDPVTELLERRADYIRDLNIDSESENNDD